MSEGWKQVWADIRHALGAPATEEREDKSVDEHRSTGAGEHGSELVLEAQPEQGAAARGGEEAEGTLLDSLAPEVGVAQPESREAEGWADGALAMEESAELAEGDADDLAEAVPEKRSWLPTALVIGVVAVAIFFWLRNPLAARPPAANVIATYDGGQITVEDVQQHLALLAPEEFLRQQLQNVEGYSFLINEMLTDALVKRWAAERKADRDDKFQHSMKHITEEMNLDQLHDQMHQQQVGVTEADILAYYNANRQQFGDQTLAQARDQILATLEAQREEGFVQDYINRLKENATISRDFALLAVPEPTEAELKDYYQANLDQYLLPAQAVVDEIRVSVGQDEAAAQDKANQALTRLRAGEEFAAVAADLSETPVSEQGTLIQKGQRDPTYDEVVFNLDIEEISEVFRAGDAFYVARLRSSQPERRQSLDEARTQVYQAVLAQKEAAWFKENANRTLFTIHGERYTLGEFWQEYQELPPTFLVNYQGAEGRQALAERLIERLLLVEDSYDQLLEAENKDELDETRLRVLTQMMEQEEVDDKIEVTDEELQAYYEEHKTELTPPPQARVRAIIIALGQTEAERKQAWNKANEAYQKLVPGLLQSGADFAEIARQYSEDEVTASKGGEVDGWIGEGPDLLAELAEHPFHQQILQLNEGEISQPFEWEGAIYIVQVLERKEKEPLTFEQAKELLREELRLKKHEELSAQLSQKLLEQANVKVYTEVLQTLIAAQTSTGPTSTLTTSE